MVNTGFSILICSWNNIAYLKLLINSIKKNSSLEHQILVHVNEGIDGTMSWLDEEEIEFTYSPVNVGLCKGTNSLTPMVQKDIICLCDDDVYVLPNWDIKLLQFKVVKELKEYWLSSTNIEPTPGPVTTVSPRNYGRNVSTFKELELLHDQKTLSNSQPLNNNQSTPTIFPRKMWIDVGGYDEDFDPGIGSEEGLTIKMWNYGCKNFVGIPDSLVYHFQCKSTSRLPPGGSQKRDEILKNKYGMTAKEFNNTCIKRGQLWIHR